MNNLDLTAYNVSPLTLIFLVDKGNILTLKRAEHKQIFPGKLSGFGGKVEPGENLMESARREMLEETGLHVQQLQLRGTFTRILDNGYINVIYIFVAEGYSGTLHQDSGEGTATWLPVAQFLQSPDIVEHIPLYLEQVLEGKDFYSGLAASDLYNRTDNVRHFTERTKNH